LIGGARNARRGRSRNAPAFRQVFIRHVHELLQYGYARLTPSTHAKEDETAITGHLVGSMNDVIDDRRSPKWVRFYAVHEDPPVRHAKKTGKRRKRVDIRFDSTERIPRTRFYFEAKRLGKGNAVGAYLGRDGLGCFLSEEYGAGEPDGGMIGYVQSHDAVHWASKLAKKLPAGNTVYAVRADGQWATIKLRKLPGDTYTTIHTRQKTKTKIKIYHSLLVFL
jgi:hypothetical protein